MFMTVYTRRKIRKKKIKKKKRDGEDDGEFFPKIQNGKIPPFSERYKILLLLLYCSQNFDENRHVIIFSSFVRGFYVKISRVICGRSRDLGIRKKY